MGGCGRCDLFGTAVGLAGPSRGRNHSRGGAVPRPARGSSLGHGWLGERGNKSNH
jgi:hypothetical protein